MGTHDTGLAFGLVAIGFALGYWVRSSSRDFQRGFAAGYYTAYHAVVTARLVVWSRLANASEREQEVRDGEEPTA